MRKARWWPMLLFALAATSWAAADRDFVVVVHPGNGIRSIDRHELSKIFLKRLRTWEDGTPVRPVDQLPGSAVRAPFTRAIHERSVVLIDVYWKRMIFSGRAVPPPELDGDDKVLEFVRSTPGAVGYVSRSVSLEGVLELNVE